MSHLLSWAGEEYRNISAEISNLFEVKEAIKQIVFTVSDGGW